MITRRMWVGGSFAGLVAGLLYRSRRSAAAEVFPVMHSDAEWRRLLTPGQYDVLRREGTEAPFTSPLLNEHRDGRFTCQGCRSALFSSATKFDSGTGWPSFWAPIDKAILTDDDSSLGMTRTEVRCSHCDGHLGHVFTDGPKPTGLRYCMNGVAMAFEPTVAATKTHQS